MKLALVLVAMLVTGCGSATATAAPSGDIANAPGSPVATSVLPEASDATPTSPAGTAPTPTVDPRTALVGCSLAQYHGDLVAENDRPILKTLGDWGARAGTVPLDWPTGWIIRPADGGQLEVLDGDGSVRVRTGTHIILLTSDYLNPFNGDGAFVVCEASPG